MASLKVHHQRVVGPNFLDANLKVVHFHPQPCILLGEHGAQFLH